LASVLLKLAVYGIIRILLPILPDATIYFTPLVYTIALISIIYSSCATLRQIDTKVIVAYSSIGHKNNKFLYYVQDFIFLFLLIILLGVISNEHTYGLSFYNSLFVIDTSPKSALADSTLLILSITVYKRGITLPKKNKYPLTSCTSLVIWGENLYSMIGQKLTRYELSLFTSFPSHIQSIIIGLILSDGFLEMSNTSYYACLSLKQGFVNMQFLLYCFQQLAHYCNSIPKIVTYTRDGKVFYALRLRTRYLPCLHNLRLLFYPEGKKIIPSYTYEFITPISLAYWIMGDGKMAKSGIYLCTDSYSIPEVVQLINILIIKFNLDCTMVLMDKKYPRIYIKKNSMPRLQQLVLPYMHSSFLYKIYFKNKSSYIQNANF
jgi:hypothetical protein